MDIVIGNIYQDTQYGDVKLLEANSDFCRVELLDDKFDYIYHDAEVGVGEYEKILLYPVGTQLILECPPEFQKIALMSYKELIGENNV